MAFEKTGTANPPESDFGEFEEVKEGEEVVVTSEEGIPTRVRLPRRGELIGVILQRFGGARMEVLCSDGQKRNCRVPGRFKRTLWLRPRDIVLIMPWPDDNTKGDVIFKYNSSAINQLRKKGLLDSLKEAF